MTVWSLCATKFWSEMNRRRSAWTELPVKSKDSVNSFRMVFWILASVAKSMLLVASSRIITELRRSSARAIAINCLWPWEKLFPAKEICVSKVTITLVSTSVVWGGIVSSIRRLITESGVEETCGDVVGCSREPAWDFTRLWGIIWTRYRASRHSSSLYSLKGSRLSLRDPENRVAS